MPSSEPLGSYLMLASAGLAVSAYVGVIGCIAQREGVQDGSEADTFKEDLGRAGIAISDEHGRTLDRHALRTTFVS